MSSYKQSINGCDASPRSKSGKAYGKKRREKFLENAKIAKAAADCRVARWSQPDPPKKSKKKAKKSAAPKPTTKKSAPKKSASKSARSKGKRRPPRLVYS